jgi:hypothetical protein
MGLDIYVGPLCRYYAGDWETVVQRHAREQGIALNVVRAQPASADALRDPKDTLPIVTAWREGLALALKDEGVSLFWQEQPDGIYFTDKPAWDCYGDLLLWAAYSEHPDLPRPEQSVTNFSDDPAYIRTQQRTRFRHLLGNAEFWLPADFDFVFEAPEPAGTLTMFGSCVGLLRELVEINDASWRGSPAELESWRKAGSDHGAPLEHGARFCCALLTDLAQHAVVNGLPMKLDY